MYFSYSVALEYFTVFCCIISTIISTLRTLDLLVDDELHVFSSILHIHVSEKHSSKIIGMLHYV